MAATLTSARTSESNASRAIELAEAPLDFIDHPEFHGRGASRKILESKVQRGKNVKRRRNRRPDNVPAYFATLYETPLLTAEEEVELFRKFNYLKYRSNVLRKKIRITKPDAKLLDEIDSLVAAAHDVWAEIVQANLRLVVSIARRFVDANHNFDDLVSDGQIALMNAIEKFDISRGFRFSTYATHAIQRTFYRRIKKSQRDMNRFKLAPAEMMADVPDNAADESFTAEDLGSLKKVLQFMETELDDRERCILQARFGLGSDNDGETLRAVGSRLGISKERVRQIQIRAIEKLQQLSGVELDELASEA